VNSSGASNALYSTLTLIRLSLSKEEGRVRVQRL